MLKNILIEKIYYFILENTFHRIQQKIYAVNVSIIFLKFILLLILKFNILLLI